MVRSTRLEWSCVLASESMSPRGGKRMFPRAQNGGDASLGTTTPTKAGQPVAPKKQKKLPFEPTPAPEGNADDETVIIDSPSADANNHESNTQATTAATPPIKADAHAGSQNNLESDMASWMKSMIDERGPPSKIDVGPQPPSSLPPRQQKHFEALTEAIEQGEFDARHKLAQQMERELGKGALKAYRNLGNTANNEFRLNWAKTQRAEFTSGHKQVDTWRTIDQETGTYMSASMAFRKQGGTTADVEPTQKMIRKAYDMGEPWIWWNWQTERYDIFVLKKQHTELFDQAWQKFVEHRSHGSVRQTSVGEGGGEVAPMRKGAGKGKGKADPISPAKPKAGRDKDGGPSANAGPGGPDPADKPERDAADPKLEMKSLLATALKTKKAFQSASSAAVHLSAEVRTGEAWRWANNETNLRELSTAQDALERAKTSFVRKFVCQEVALVRKDYCKGSFRRNLQIFSEELDPLIESLSQATTTLLVMHAARTKCARR